MDLLELCPVCCYCLEGLPDNHICPECGFEYDRRMKVFDQSPALAILLGTFIALTLLLTLYDQTKLGTASGILGLIGMLYWSIWYVSRYSIKKRNRGVVGPHAIYLISDGSILHKFKCDEISSIKVKARSGEIMLFGFRDAYQVGDEFFGSHKWLVEFFKCAEAALQPPPQTPDS